MKNIYIDELSARLLHNLTSNKERNEKKEDAKLKQWVEIFFIDLLPINR